MSIDDIFSKERYEIIAKIEELLHKNEDSFQFFIAVDVNCQNTYKAIQGRYNLRTNYRKKD